MCSTYKAIICQIFTTLRKVGENNGQNFKLRLGSLRTDPTRITWLCKKQHSRSERKGFIFVSRISGQIRRSLFISR